MEHGHIDRGSQEPSEAGALPTNSCCCRDRKPTSPAPKPNSRSLERRFELSRTLAAMELPSTPIDRLITRSIVTAAGSCRSPLYVRSAPLDLRFPRRFCHGVRSFGERAIADGYFTTSAGDEDDGPP